MAFIINDHFIMESEPTNLKKTKNDNLRFECVLQTVDTRNRNGRMYPRKVLNDSIQSIMPRVKSGGFLGELDHPIDTNPIRQTTVQYKGACHRILEIGWDGNKLIGTLETLRTPNGNILKNLAEDGLPIGFSYRGMGDARRMESAEGAVQVIQSPLMTITYDTVTYPSHIGAELIRITEGVTTTLTENASRCGCGNKNLFLSENVILEENIIEENGLICTNEGMCFIPSAFDKLVERRIIKIKKKFSI